MSALLVGYARCSTDQQDLTAHRDALLDLGVEAELIYVDHGLTGTNRERPGLREALAACRAGDTLVVTKLDRLARPLPDARACPCSIARPSRERPSRRKSFSPGRESTLIAAAGRVQAVLRWILVSSLVLLAAGFLFVAPFLESPETAGIVGVVLGALMGTGFTGLILGSLIIGPLLLRAPGLRTGARVLTAMLPVLGVTMLLAFVAKDWAHPAYLETTLHFGIALLGVDAVRRGRQGGSAAPGAFATQVGVDAHPSMYGDRSSC